MSDARRDLRGPRAGSRAGQAIIVALVVAALARPEAAPTRVLLGMVLPANSLWHKAMMEMADDWRKTTEKRVDVRIVPGAGEEATLVQRMRNDVLQASALSVIALSGIDRAFDVFTTPMFFESYDELFHVANRLRPAFEKRLEQKGFVLLNWGHGGWVQVFSKQPVRTVEDLKRVKLFTSAGDDDMVQWYRRNGFRPVPLAVNDVPMALQVGMIEALPTTPLLALSVQWYKLTPYMAKIGIAPVVGATLVTTRTWEKISEPDRERLRQSTKRLEDRLEAEVPKQDEIAIAEMHKRGLNIIAIEGPLRDEWRKAAETFASSVRGSRVEAEIFDAAVRARDDFRRGRAPAGGAR